MNDRHDIPEFVAEVTASKVFAVAAGTAAGILIIVFAVLISAHVFQVYGWGLFVLTPIGVGFTTGYLFNRRELQTLRATHGLVLISAALGCLALVLFALEGFICLILVSPLAAALAMLGGWLGRSAARIGKDPKGPLYCVVLLPAMFAADAASPPALVIQTDESMVIAAPVSRVWRAVTSEEPIREPATVAGRLGLAYPQRAHLSAGRVGAVRIGYFSTGEAFERITGWEEGRLLAFEVISQPPAMSEMSPHRRVYAPHVDGYFQTGETRFQLEPLADGHTRLSIQAAHRLRIDPVIYWEPIARWAVRSNTRRVLRDIKEKAERAR